MLPSGLLRLPPCAPRCYSPAIQPLLGRRAQPVTVSGIPEEAPTPLALTTRVLDDRTIVSCAGSLLLGEESDALRDLVRKLLPTSRVIILDLAGIGIMDSGGIGTLVGLTFSARNAGASLKLARPSPRIHTLFQLTRLSPVFEFVDMAEPSAAAGGVP